MPNEASAVNQIGDSVHNEASRTGRRMIAVRTRAIKVVDS
jgi:hypothetical protein